MNSLEQPAISVQSLSHVWLFATPWTAAHQASLSITNSQSLLKLMSIESVMPSNHLIFCHPFLLLPSVFPSIWVFSNELVLLIRGPKYWSLSISINPSNEYLGLISFRMDWLDLLAVQGTFKNLLQHPSSKTSILSSPPLITSHLIYCLMFMNIVLPWHLPKNGLGTPAPSILPTLPQTPGSKHCLLRPPSISSKAISLSTNCHLHMIAQAAGLVLTKLSFQASFAGYLTPHYRASQWSWPEWMTPDLWCHCLSRAMIIIHSFIIWICLLSRSSFPDPNLFFLLVVVFFFFGCIFY